MSKLNNTEASTEPWGDLQPDPMSLHGPRDLLPIHLPVQMSSYPALLQDQKHCPFLVLNYRNSYITEIHLTELKEHNELSLLQFQCSSVGRELI